jgi:hypothetical protein
MEPDKSKKKKEKKRKKVKYEAMQHWKTGSPKDWTFLLLIYPEVPQNPMSPFYDRWLGLFERLPCMNAVDIVRVGFICGHPMNGMRGIG